MIDEHDPQQLDVRIARSTAATSPRRSRCCSRRAGRHRACRSRFGGSISILTSFGHFAATRCAVIELELELGRDEVGALRLAPTVNTRHGILRSGCGSPPPPPPSRRFASARRRRSTNAAALAVTAAQGSAAVRDQPRAQLDVVLLRDLLQRVLAAVVARGDLGARRERLLDPVAVPASAAAHSARSAGVGHANPLVTVVVWSGIRACQTGSGSIDAGRPWNESRLRFVNASTTPRFLRRLERAVVLVQVDDSTSRQRANSRHPMVRPCAPC